jgi:hypothetical protein
VPFLGQNLKVAVRHLFKLAGFTIIAVLMLAFGIGETTAILSIAEESCCAR